MRLLRTGIQLLSLVGLYVAVGSLILSCGGQIGAGWGTAPMWLVRLAQSYELADAEKLELNQGYRQLERSPKLFNETVRSAYEAVGMTADKAALLNPDLVEFVGEAIQVTQLSSNTLGQFLQQAQGLGISSPQWKEYLEAISRAEQVLARVGKSGDNGLATYNRMFALLRELKYRGIEVDKIYGKLILEYAEVESVMISQRGDPEIPYKILLGVVERPDNCTKITGKPWSDVSALLRQGDLLDLVKLVRSHINALAQPNS